MLGGRVYCQRTASLLFELGSNIPRIPQGRNVGSPGQLDLSQTKVSEILGSTFARCAQLQQLSLSQNLRIIEQEAFLNCTSLQEVCTPPSLLYIARRALAGCTQLRAFWKKGKSKTWRGTYARPNAFDKCEQLDKPKRLRFLPPNDNDQ